MSLSCDKSVTILKKIITNNDGGIPVRWLDDLGDLKSVAFKVIQHSGNPEARAVRLRAELLQLGRIELFAEVEAADPEADPDQIETPGYKFRTFAETYQELPPLKWVIKKLFPRPSVSIAFGMPKELKSMLLLDGAVCVAGGTQNWLTGENGQGGFPVEQVPVVWLDLESGVRRMVERISAFGRARGLRETIPFFGLRCLRHGPISRNPKELAPLLPV